MGDEIQIISSSKPSKNKKTKKRKLEQTTPQKRKKRKLSKEQNARDRVRDFMLTQNRPHSKNSVKLELNQSDEIWMKEFGKKSKTKIYWANQDNFENEDDEETNDRVKEIENEIKAKKAILNGIRSEINSLSKEPTDSMMKEEMFRTVQIKNECDRKLKELKGSNGAIKVSQADIDENLIKFHKYGKVWKERKGILYEMISKIWQDSNDKPDKILTKIIGGETDKDNNVEWEQYKEIYKKSSTLVQQQKDQKKKSKVSKITSN